VELNSELLRGRSSRDKEVQSLALQQLDCVERKMHWCTVLLKDKVVINDVYVIIASKSLQCTCYGCVACLKVAYMRNICEFEWNFGSR